MQENILLLLQAITLLGVIFAIYKYFRDPDIRSQDQINVMQATCKQKHQYVDENLKILAENFTSIKNNELKHIERSIKELELNQMKIFTILDERLPKK